MRATAKCQAVLQEVLTWKVRNGEIDKCNNTRLPLAYLIRSASVCEWLIVCECACVRWALPVVTVSCCVSTAASAQISTNHSLIRPMLVLPTYRPVFYVYTPSHYPAAPRRMRMLDVGTPVCGNANAGAAEMACTEHGWPLCSGVHLWNDRKLFQIGAL